MAIPSPITTNNIKKTMGSFASSLKQARKSAQSGVTNLEKKTKARRRFLIDDNILFNRRKEAVRRKQQQDIIEANKLGLNPRRSFLRGFNTAANNEKGFLGKILDFAGTLLVGWLLSNLPTIIFMGKQLIARIQMVVSIGKAFIFDIGSSFLKFGGLLGAVGKDIATFDFFDTSKRVARAMNDLGSNFDDMKKQIEDGMSLFTTPLTKDIKTGQEAPPTGTRYSTQPSGVEDRGGGTQKNQASSGTPRQKALLNTISFAEGNTGYSTWAGYQKHGPDNLTNLTIGEIVELQKSFISSGKAKKTGSAVVGRYQFLYPERFAAQAGLSINDKFSEENQDKMAIAELNRIGVTDQLLQREGGFTQRVASLLAPVWASIPTSSGGSYYGQGSKSLKSLQNVYNRNIGNTSAEISQPQQPQVSQAAQTAPTERQSAPGPAPRLDANRRYYNQQNISGQIGKGVITTLYKDPERPSHNGIDIAVPIGTYIALRVDCEVIDYGNTNPTGYGLEIHVWVPQYQIRFKMAHLTGVLVTSGKVPAGKSFARSGKSGRSTGPHIHFEAGPRNNYKGDRDPSPYVPLLLLTDGPNKGSFTPAAINPQQNRAQIAAPPMQSQQFAQQMTPDRQGPTVILTPQQQQEQQARPSSGSQFVPIPMMVNTLNTFTTNRILLELAYT